MVMRLQTPVPELLISVASMGRMGCNTCVYMPADPPSRLGWGLGPARPPVRGHAVDDTRSAAKGIGSYPEYQVIRKDEFLKSPPVSDREPARTRGLIPGVQIASPTESDDGKVNEPPSNKPDVTTRSRQSRVYSNLHAFFDKARHFAGNLKKHQNRMSTGETTSQKRRGSIGGDKHRTIFISITSKLLWDEEVGGPLEKKKTWINIPEICMSAPELIPLAEAVPVSHVNLISCSRSSQMT